MRRWSWLLMLLGACTRSGLGEPMADEPPAAAVAPTSDPLGEPGDEPVVWSASGQWVAVCRPDGGDGTPKLLVGAHHEVELDTVLLEDPTGRYLVISRDGERILYDAVTRHEHVLGSTADIIAGSFDEDGEQFAYGRKVDGRREAVVRTLSTGAEQWFPAPVYPMTKVSLDPSGRHLWMSAWESDPGDEPRTDRDADMCKTRRGCGMAWSARHVGTAVNDLVDPGSGAVRIEPMDTEPRALAEQLVMETDVGIELVHALERRTIAGPGCTVEHTAWRDEAMVVSCPASGSSREFFEWREDRLRSLGSGWSHFGWTLSEDYGPYPATAIRGPGGRWLSLTGPHVVQGLADQSEGYAYEGRVLLVGGEMGVEVRDGATDTQVVRHELRAKMDQVQGPFVALRATSASRDGGWVIDVRDGRIVREYERPALALSTSGHVAVRDDDGRLRWR